MRRLAVGIATAVLGGTLAGLAGTGPVAEAGGAEPVGIVGDSISFEALEEIPDIVTTERPVGFHETELGIELRDIQNRVITALNRPGAPDILVMVIGTSQAQHDPPHTWRTDLRAFLDAATPLVDCVRVFDIQERYTPVYKQLGKWGPLYNDITADIVDDYAEVESFHYSAWVDLTGPELDAGDGLHHNRAGERAVARLIRDAAAGCDPAFTTGPFWDVRDAFWAAEAIAWMGGAGHATGYPNGTYRATIGDYTIPVSRGQYTAMLWRIAGSPGGYPAHPWSDGQPWLDGALRWAWAEGVASGYPNGTFRPDRAIERGQAAQQLWRLSGAPVEPPTHGWSDGQPWLESTLDWLATHDLMSGYPDGTFRPDVTLDRAQIARLLHRHDQLPAAASAEAPPPDDQPGPATTVPSSTAPATTVPGTTAVPSTTVAPTTPTTAG